MRCLPAGFDKSEESPMLPKIFKLFAVVAFLGLLSAGQVSAHEYKLGELTIEHPWAAESIGAIPTGVAYMTIINGGNVADRLLSVSTPAAKEAQLHTNLVEDGVMKMRQLKAVEVNPGAPAAFQPNSSLHIMLIGVTKAFKAGDKFPMTLTFEKAGTIDVEVLVQKRGAENHDMMMHHDHTM
jgi:copper(I)-binding protein